MNLRKHLQAIDSIPDQEVTRIKMPVAIYLQVAEDLIQVNFPRPVAVQEGMEDSLYR